ncbi:hypothetical protein [Thermaurantiacus tibetensis]|uniref:phage tail terminator protein n=1 Tax=Thermaurantiacus tibetensis TaxID=2759035 RepID=UPI00188F7392|nr:hypothetical protein [Thermaurantiacus tibetensis]
MSTVEAVIALLREGPFKRVDGALALAQLATEPTVALPAAFVLEEGSTTQDAAQGSQIFEQVETATIAVVVVVGGDAARRGAAERALEDLAEAVVSRLFAAAIPGLERPLAYQGGQLLGLDGGRVTRILRFRAVRRLRLIVS